MRRAAALAAMAVLATLMTVTPVWAAGRTADRTPPAAIAADVAVNQVGDPYVWGATGPSAFDCSGLVDYAYAKVGIDLPRTTQDLWYVGTPIHRRSNLKTGDLVFTSRHHVGVYTGNGRIVHAPYPGRSVTEVPIWHFVRGARVTLASRLRFDVNNVFRSELDGRSRVMYDIDHVFKSEILRNQVGLLELNRPARGDINRVYGNEIVRHAVSGRHAPGGSEIRPHSITREALAPALTKRLSMIRRMKHQIDELQAKVAALKQQQTR